MSSGSNSSRASNISVAAKAGIGKTKATLGGRESKRRRLFWDRFSDPRSRRHHRPCRFRRRFVLMVIFDLVDAHEAVAFVDQRRDDRRDKGGRLAMDAMHQHDAAVLATDLAQIALGAGVCVPSPMPAIPIGGTENVSVVAHGDVAA